MISGSIVTILILSAGSLWCFTSSLKHSKDGDKEGAVRVEKVEENVNESGSLDDQIYGGRNCDVRLGERERNMIRDIIMGVDERQGEYCEEIITSTNINLKVTGQDGNEAHFRVKQSTQMAKLKKSYCERVRVPVNSMFAY